jgi:excisionase family DNA binding protein
MCRHTHQLKQVAEKQSNIFFQCFTISQPRYLPTRADVKATIPIPNLQYKNAKIFNTFSPYYILLNPWTIMCRFCRDFLSPRSMLCSFTKGLNMKELLNTKELAEYLGVTAQTLRQYRLDGRGPVYLKIGHLVRYRLSDVEQWLVTQTN